MVDQNKIIDKVLDDIRGSMPDEVVGRYKDIGSQMNVEFLSTGSIAADAALGGGIPKGRITDIVGFASSGKTTLALSTIAELQRTKPDAKILYIDAECSLDPIYMKALGVDLNSIYMVQPNNGDNGYNIAIKFLNSGIMDLIIIDSIAAMIPKAMLEYQVGENVKIGVGATIDSQGIAHMYNIASKTKTAVLLINQWKKAVRTNMFDAGDGISGQYYQPGGETIKFFLSQMIEIKRGARIARGNDYIASTISMITRKNKVFPPLKTADFYISLDGKGVMKSLETIDLGIQSGLINLTGKTYTIEGHEKGIANRLKFMDWLDENPDEMQNLRDRIREKIINRDIIAQDGEGHTLDDE
jgi:recombination protein RecA